MIETIISGGQTGADQGGLRAGKFLGLKTGGHIPKRFRTDDGECPELGERYGLIETPTTHYAPRTEMNVKNSDGTIVVGRPNSAGTNLTLKMIEKYNKPRYTIFFDESMIPDNNTKSMIRLFDLNQSRSNFLFFLRENNIKILNVAGNRESSNKGIERFTFEFLVYSLHEGAIENPNFVKD